MFEPNDDYHLALAREIHNDNILAGWWTCLETGEPLERDPYELLMLVYTEIAEAMEGHRKNRMDDKLPHLKMFDVEIADTAIRLYDILGKFISSDLSFLKLEFHNYEWHKAKSTGGDLFLLCHAIYPTYTPNDIEPDTAWSDPVLAQRVTRMIDRVWAFSRAYDIDLQDCMLQKREFNKSRADHKPENIRAEGGKKC